jgi:hypothetical protein
MATIANGMRFALGVPFHEYRGGAVIGKLNVLGHWTEGPNP